MNGKIIFCAFFLIIEINCIQVTSDNENSTTTSELPPLKELQPEETVIETTTYESLKDEEKLITVGNEVNTDQQITTTSIITTTSAHKIPPTLLNTRIEYTRVASEKPTKSLKDIANPTVALFHPKTMGQAIDARVKQAVINSKEQAFKNLNNLNSKQETKNTKVHDQIARPAEVQNDISKENPKNFLPSPEVSPLYSRENLLQDHFNPMNHYYRPAKQDARFPTETPFSSNPMLDTRWLGGNRSPNEIGHQSYGSIPSLQHQQGRSTNVDFPPYHNTQHVHRHYQHEEKFSFPSDEPSAGGDGRHTLWPIQNPLPQPIYKSNKGSWKWVPDEEYHPRNTTEYPREYHYSEPEPKITYGTQTPHEAPRIQTSRDRPYQFDSHEGGPYNHLHNNHNSPSSVTIIESTGLPTGPGAWPSSGSDTLLTTEEYTSGKHDEHIKSGHSKHLRPSPWKKIIHVLGAAIPIGIIISALTPRIVYVHPNATVPTLQPPLNQNSFVNPNQFGNPNQQFVPPSGQAGSPPFPQRVREGNIEPIIDSALAQFLKTMEIQYREKQHRNGDELDGICEDRFFCEIALLGKLPNSDALHQTLYNVALETPNSVAKRSGLGDVFKAIKRQNCDVLKCSKNSY